MKKGLLSILAGALLVVGCQDYDTQFDKLEDDIAALATTVSGLAQVQSELTSLSGTVASLSSTVNGLGAQIDTAVSDGLSEIQEDITAIETAVADVASSAEVASLSDAVAESQEDLDQLLTNGSIFQNDVLVNSVATLDVFHKMGSGLNIVNGNVTIQVNSTMDMTKVQELVDNILTTVKDFTYTSAASDITPVTFTKLTGTQSLTVTQAGSYDFRNLVSATNITLGSTFKSTVTLVHFGALASVTKFTTGTTANAVTFSKATELHLTSLPRYTTSSSAVLTLEVDEGGVIDLTALDDVDASAEQADIFMKITGPASFTATKFEDGSLEFVDVKTVEVNGFNGTIVTGEGVESFTADSLVDTYSVGVDLETLNVTGKVDPDVATDQSGPAISSSSNNLESVTIAGNVESVSLTSAGNLESVTVSADVAGAIDISTNGDLTSITLTGSKATGVTVSGNNEMTSLTIDTTIQAGRGATAAATALLKKNGSIAVTSNTDLESLVITSSDLKTLTVTGNASLETITGTKIAAVGVTAGASVSIFGNNFTATKSADNVNTATTLTDTGEASDLGKFTTTSGLDSLATFLALVVKDTKATASVYFDTVESYVGEDGVEDGTDATYSSTTTRDATTANAEQRILVLEADNSVAALGATAAKRAFYIDLSAINSAATIQFNDTNSNALLSTAATAFATVAAPSLGATDTPQSALAKLQAGASVARAANFDITYAAKRGGNNTGTVSLVRYLAGTTTPTTVGERYRLSTDAVKLAAVSSTAYGVGIDDLITFAVGGNSVTVSPGYASGAATTLVAIADKIAAMWTTKYGPTGTASGSAIVSVTATKGVLTVTGLSGDSASYDKEMKVSIAAGKTTATDAANLDWMIGSTVDPNDNNTVDTDVIVTFASTKLGTNLNTVAGLTSVANGTSTIIVELFSTAKTNTSIADGSGETVGYVAAQEARADVVNAEGDTAGTAASNTRFTRVHWL